MTLEDYDKPRSVTPKRQKRKRILVVTEGAVTEKCYFEELKKFIELKKNQLYVHVECGPDHKGNTPSNVVRSAKKLRDEAINRQKVQDDLGNLESREAYDEVWVVFDTERDGRNIDLKPAAEDAKRQNIQVAISRPSFESWFLLHLRDGLPGMATCADVCAEISRITNSQFKKKYRKKSKKNCDLNWLIETILPSTKEAITRGIRVERTAFSTHALVPDQSGTKVHRLVKILWGASQKGSLDAIQQAERNAQLRRSRAHK